MISVMIVLRGAVAVVAVVACAWFAIAAHQAHEINAATSVLANSNRLTDIQVRAVSSALNSAATLNPDQHVNVLRGELALAQGQRGRARTILRNVIYREPKDLEAFEWFVRASSDSVNDYYAGQIGINRLAPGILSHH